MDNHYKGLIWTNHAIARMRERGISQGDAWATWNSPQQSRKGNSAGIWIYYRTYGRTRIEVVAQQNEKKEWVIISVWSDPVKGHTSANSINSERSRRTFWGNLVKLIFNK